MKVQAKDPLGADPNRVVAAAPIAYQVTAALTGVTLTTSSVTMTEGRTLVPATKKILLTATAAGGAKNSYQFFANGKALAPASVMASCTWAPAVAGPYDLTVQVLDANGAAPATPATSNALAFTVAPLLATVTLAAAPAAPRPVNMAITLTATATGGTPDAGGTRQLLYQFLVDGQPLNVNYTADATGSWTPSTAKSYTLAVRVKDSLGADPLRVVVSPAASYPVTTALGGVTLTTASVTMTEGRTLVPGMKKILLTASAGGAKNSYQFFANGKALAPASGTASTTWVPTVAGDYDLTVQVLDANGAAPATPVTSNTLAFTVAPPLTAVTLTAPAVKQPTNVAITLAATATGGTPDAGGTRQLRYQFLVDGQPLDINYTAAATCRWTPSTAKTYSLAVRATDPLGADPLRVVTSPAVPLTVIQAMTAVSLVSRPAATANPPTVVKSYAPVVLNATANGGGRPLYQFMVDDLSNPSAAVVARSFANYTEFTWIPRVGGQYRLTVQAKDQDDPTAAVVVSEPLAFTALPPLIGVTLSAPQGNGGKFLSQPFTFTATTNGGSDLRYQFLVNDTVAQAYSPTATFTWSPAAEATGTYAITVQVRDLNGYIPDVVQSTTLRYILAPPLTDFSLTATPPSQATTGSTVNLKFDKNVGGARLVYQFLVNNEVVRDYASAAAYAWTAPAAVGPVTLTLRVKELGGTAAEPPVYERTLTYAIVDPISAVMLEASPALNAAVNSPISLLATPTGGAHLSHQFYVNGQPLGDPSATGATTWTPTTDGTYVLRVVTTDSNGDRAASAPSTIHIEPALTAVSLASSNGYASCIVGHKVVLLATATGGASCLYRFRAGETVIQDYSADDRCDWTPALTGVYDLAVDVRDAHSANALASISSDVLSYTVADGISLVTVAADKDGPRTVGDTVTLTAAVTGGTNLNYQFLVDGIVVRDWSADSTWVWSPSAVAVRALTVKAKSVCDPDTQNIVASAPLNYAITPALSPMLTLSASTSSPRAMGDTLTLHANATGGAAVQYRFLVDGVVARDWAAGPDYAWTPAATKYGADAYALTVEAKDVNGLAPATVYTADALAYQILPALSGVSLSASSPSVLINTPVTLTATPTGGANVHYEYAVNNGAGDDVIQVHSSSATCVWSPTLPGAYTLKVTAHDANDQDQFTTDYTATVTNFVVNLPASGVSLQAAPIGPSAAGSSIVLTALPIDGNVKTYKFLVPETQLWQESYSATDTYTWTPTQAGTYTLRVKMLADGTEYTSTPASYTITPALTAVSLAASPAVPVAVDVPVRFAAVKTGGGVVYYQYLVNDIVVRDWNDQWLLNWTPAATGTYTVTVRAKDMAGPNPVAGYYEASSTFTVSDALTAVSLSALPASPRTTGATVTLTATATGGARPLYAFYAGETQLSDFTADATFAWTPAAAGNYALTVVAMDPGGLTPTRPFTSSVVNFTVTDPLTAVTLSPLQASPGVKGYTVRLNAIATGGANLAYEFLIPETGQWQASYAGTPSFDWTPEAAGTYTLQVRVRDLNGSSPETAIASSTVSYVITEPLTAVSLDASPTSPRPVNTAVTLTGTAAGGAAVSYQFLVNGVIARDHASDPTFTWTPTATGSYTLQVVAQEEDLAMLPDGATLDFATLAQSAPQTYVVTDPLTAASLTADPATTSAVDTAVALTAAATGGASPEYRFLVNGTTVRDYAAGDTYSWTPSTAGTYTLTVSIRDKHAADPTATVTSAGVSHLVYAAPAKLTYSVQPTSIVAGGAITPAVQVRVLDADNNLVANATTAVTLAIGTNPGGGTLTGTLTVNAVNGVATFSTLSLDKAGTGYTLTASAAGLTGATSSAFNVMTGTPAMLAYGTQPSNVAVGEAISPAVTVRVEDAKGNLVTTATNAITLAIATNPGGGTLTGTLTANAVNGVATFSTLSIDKVGTGYTLAASATGLTGATSSAFNVTTGTPTTLAYGTQPSSVAAGAAISPAVTVRVLDAKGNLVTTATTAITLAIGTNPGGGTLGGTLTANAVNGVATFSTLSIDKVGAGYTLTASATGLTGATSTAFNVTPGAAASLAYSQQPTSAIAGAAISPAITVRVLDAHGNLVTTATTAVTLAIGTNPGGGTLAGTVTVNAVNGVATFSTLWINKAGTGYTLTAAATGLTGATSTAFNITAQATAVKLAFVQQPANGTKGTALTPAVTVEVQDTYGNRITTATNVIAMNLATTPVPPNGASVTGNANTPAVAGLATFSALNINKAGTYALTATSTGLTSATSTTFTLQ